MVSELAGQRVCGSAGLGSCGEVRCKGRRAECGSFGCVCRTRQTPLRMTAAFMRQQRLSCEYAQDDSSIYATATFMLRILEAGHSIAVGKKRTSMKCVRILLLG